MRRKLQRWGGLSLSRKGMVLVTIPQAGVLDAGMIAGLREMGAGPHDLLELIETFIGDASTRIDELRRGVGGADVVLVARICHSLRGSSGNLGASQMAGLCAELENAATDHELAGGPEILLRLEDEFERVRPALTAAFAI